MELLEQLNQQRVKHIISSYQLNGSDTGAFDSYLDGLFRVYPSPLIELALVEILVDCWLQVPMTRGCQFLVQVQELLQSWENNDVVSTIAPAQFHQITGLDPTPIFGATGTPSPQPHLNCN